LSNTSPSATDLTEVATHLVDAATEQDLRLRLVGGVAIRLQCRSAPHAQLARTFGDIDLCGVSKLDYESFFVARGYEPSIPFNRLNATRYQRFDDTAQQIHIDLFLDRIEMCHQLQFRDRLDLDPYTLSPADLLLTKLQIVELNEKDIQDVVALLLDHPLGASDAPGEISLARIAEICARDWGWWRTSHETLERCIAWVESHNSIEFAPVRGALERLIATIDEVPKSRRWKMRASVGDRVRWYELPEDPTRS
jgi:hypothetical protein